VPRFIHVAGLRPVTDSPYYKPGPQPHIQRSRRRAARTTAVARDAEYHAGVDRERVRLHAGLWIGVIAVSWGAIFIRLADAPALSVSAYRLLFGALPVAVFAVVRRRWELARLNRTEWGMLGLSGLALALHFATWIASLGRTTVASSVALVTTQPVWVWLLLTLLLREPVSRRGTIAILVATAGGFMIAGADISVASDALVGDLLALAGGLFAAVYFIAGRRVRPTLSLGAYVGVVYSVAAIGLVVAALLAGQPFGGFSGKTWSMLLLLALVPQLLGHSLLNWSLKYFSATTVSVVILGEPVISSALAVPILGEQPGLLRLAGAAVILAGVYLAVREETAHSSTPASPQVVESLGNLTPNPSPTRRGE
jgi:drug/metabolite transporter (DMT)-like permease